MCFTEAPIAQLALSLADREGQNFKYRPAGIMVDKKWAFEKVARTALYQPDEEFEWLPECMRYRHVLYDPENEVDFTWAREWRLLADELEFTPNDVTLILPNRKWSDAFYDSWIEDEKSMTGEEIKTNNRPGWHVVALTSE